MKIIPVRLKTFVSQKIEQNKIARQAMEQLEDLYGDAFEYVSTLKNKKGTVTVFGYPSKDAPYSHAYSILSTGEHIQTLASRKQTKGGNFVDDFTRLITRPDGSNTVETYSVVRNEFGDILQTKKGGSGSFTLKKKEPKVIDFQDAFNKK